MTIEDAEQERKFFEQLWHNVACESQNSARGKEPVEAFLIVLKRWEEKITGRRGGITDNVVIG